MAQRSPSSPPWLMTHRTLVGRVSIHLDRHPLYTTFLQIGAIINILFNLLIASMCSFSHFNFHPCLSNYTRAQLYEHSGGSKHGRRHRHQETVSSPFAICLLHFIGSTFTVDDLRLYAPYRCPTMRISIDRMPTSHPRKLDVHLPTSTGPCHNHVLSLSTSMNRFVGMSLRNVWDAIS